MTVSIDSNKPIPMRGTKWPLSEMEVGDSFLIKEPSAGSRSLAGLANNRFSPKRFMSRSVIEDGVKGIRIWRYE